MNCSPLVSAFRHYKLPCFTPKRKAYTPAIYAAKHYPFHAEYPQRLPQPLFLFHTHQKKQISIIKHIFLG